MALRALIDEHGTQWTVFAVKPVTAVRATVGMRAELAQGWSCFQSETERRRLPGIPGGWDAMGNDVLLAMPADAPVAPRTSRPRRSQHRAGSPPHSNFHG
jgi:hypothetical protein